MALFALDGLFDTKMQLVNVCWQWHVAAVG